MAPCNVTKKIDNREVLCRIVKATAKQYDVDVDAHKCKFVGDVNQATKHHIIGEALSCLEKH